MLFECYINADLAGIFLSSLIGKIVDYAALILYQILKFDLAMAVILLLQY